MNPAILLAGFFAVSSPPVSEFRTPATELVQAARTWPGVALSREDDIRYSGVGAIRCVIDGGESSATAFLVGSFDVAVTVAHTFLREGARADPDNCMFISSDREGEIVERIPVTAIHSQWDE